MMPEPLLRTQNLVKNFGAMTVTASLDLTIQPGETHAVIGPNGAGKTTLIAQLAGELQPDEGAIFFQGRNVTRRPVHERARMGIGRVFQITSVFGAFPARDNVLLALRAHRPRSFDFWRNGKADPQLLDECMVLIEKTGLGDRATVPASALSHGEKRQLELAMALAGNPKLLLLDEPTAGMGAEDTQRMVALLAELRGTVAILLVEHDMDAVYALADRVTVLVYGRAIAEGTVGEIRANPKVREAYLGEEQPGARHAAG